MFLSKHLVLIYHRFKIDVVEPRRINLHLPYSVMQIDEVPGNGIDLSHLRIFTKYFNA